MRKIALLCLIATLPLGARAATTINSTNSFSYGANIGWMNWRHNQPAAGDGVVIGEYVCSGYIYGANVGWINMGSGEPTNKIQYSNTSGTDFGVNYTVDPNTPGVAFLRGYAYGANIGWINFDAPDNPFPPGVLKPQVSFFTGKLRGYIYSANCGWISLAEFDTAMPPVEHFVQTDTIAPGIDTDGDGIADAFEFIHTDPDLLTTMNSASDRDGDGMTDVQEYLEGTNPNLPGDRLRIISLAITARDATNTSTQLLWASTVSRLYAIDTATTLVGPNNWSDLGLDSGPNSVIPSVGASTTRTVVTPTTPNRFFRVRAVRPLAP